MGTQSDRRTLRNDLERAADRVPVFLGFLDLGNHSRGTIGQHTPDNAVIPD